MTKNDFMVTSIFKIIIRIFKKNFNFCGKTPKFLPKRCLFIFCIFLFKWRGINPTSMSNKNKKKRSKTIIQLIIIISKAPEKLSPVALVTNWYKLLPLPLVARPWWKFEKQKVLNFNLVIVTSNKLYFYSLHVNFKCIANKHREQLLL